MMAAPKSHDAMRLSALLQGIVDVRDVVDCDVTGITLDSRNVQPGDMFFALGGSKARGHDFIAHALAAGAAAVLWEKTPGLPAIDATKIAHGKRHGTPFIGVENLAQRMGEIAARFYGDPSRQMRVIAVTGTNGKTSCTHFIARALNEDAPCGIVGTLGYGLVRALDTATHTTPDAVSLQRLLAWMRAEGATSVAMEASSHALHQGRVNGTHIETTVFTNLTRDHLDYHSSMEEYGAAKARLFLLPDVRHAVINADDEYGRQLLRSLPSRLNLVSYGLAGTRIEPRPAIFAEHVQLSAGGLRMRVYTPWGSGDVRSALLGRFNASNLLAALGALLVSGMTFDTAIARLATMTTVPGRMERFGGDGKPLVVVDYAHTPDALRHVLQALREHCRGLIHCVFGCGGDRDRGKRPLMGRIAEEYADRVIVTDDNPRNEDAEQIVRDILAGFERAGAAMLLHDRAAAIAHAVRSAKIGDVVLIAGKGHETYQIVGAHQYAFSDAAHVCAALDGSPP